MRLYLASQDWWLRRSHFHHDIQNIIKRITGTIAVLSATEVSFSTSGFFENSGRISKLIRTYIFQLIAAVLIINIYFGQQIWFYPF
jgi:hypothetical protein